MKHTFILLALFAFAFGCKTNDPDTLPQEIIKLDDANWEYSQKSSLIQVIETPERHDIYVKIDGADGSYLYLVLPWAYLNALPSLPQEYTGKAAYYPNSSVQTDFPFEGQATIQLLEIDGNQQQLRLAFDAIVYEKISGGQDSIARHFESGELSDIDFNEVKAIASTLDYEIKKDQTLWPVSEVVSHMHYGQLNWIFYNYDLSPESGLIGLNIPWGQALGTFQIDPSNNFPIGLRTGKSWAMESAEITLEENNFLKAKQKGRFKAVFHDANFPDQKFEITDGRFEVNF